MNDAQIASENRRRIMLLEEKVDFLLRELGLDDKFYSTRPPSPSLDEVVALVRIGRKLEAIKLYIQITGADLASAKAAVDQMSLPWPKQ